MDRNLSGISPPLRVVLVGINSQFIHSSLAPWCLRAALAMYAQAGHASWVVEGTANEIPEALLERIMRLSPDLVGFSCYIWNIVCVSALLPRLKAALPACRVVLGGPEVGFRAREVMEALPDADFLITGEGELPLARLADALCGLGMPRDVPGLSFREEGLVLANPPMPPPSVWPSPYSQEYLSSLGGRIAYLETGRGCPFSCAFCLSGREERPRWLPLARTFSEIGMLANAGARTVKLVDRTFNVDRARAKSVLRYLVSQAGRTVPAGVCFHFEMAGDLLDEETLEIVGASPPGLFRFEVGLQSFNEMSLAASRRTTDLPRLTEMTARLIACGRARVHLDLIAGLPHETPETFARGFDRTFLLQPHELQLGFLKLLPGSAMREERNAYPCEYDRLPPYAVRSTPWMGEEDLDKLRLIARAVDRLYNSGRFRRFLDCLIRGEGLRPYELFLRLGLAIRAAENGGAALSLNSLTDLVFSNIADLLPGMAAFLRDLLLLDRLSASPSADLPGCLKRREPRAREVRRALDRLYPRAPGVLRSLGFLYASQVPEAVFCDQAGRDPVTGGYPLHRLPVSVVEGTQTRRQTTNIM